jgi:hypothetical protein
VGDTIVAGESRRASAVRERLAADRAPEDEGVRWLLVQHAPGEHVSLEGLVTTHRGSTLDLYRNPRYRPPAGHSPSRTIAVLTGYLLAAAILTAAIGNRLHRIRKNLENGEHRHD